MGASSVAIRRPKPEVIAARFFEVEVVVGQGMPRINVTTQIRVSDFTAGKTLAMNPERTVALEKQAICPYS
jgi:hypothetical protein